MGVNGIKRATLTYFLTFLMINFWEIFLEYFWNILNFFPKKSLNFSSGLIKVYVKKLAKNVIFKKFQIHL
jgi:hypothetical protein